MNTRLLASVPVVLGLVGAVTLLAQTPKENSTFKADRAKLQPLAAVPVEGQGTYSPFEGAKASIQKVAPGGSVAVNVSGKFGAGTLFLSERDGVALSGAAISTSSYSARMTVAPNELPGFARVFAFTPHIGEGFLSVAFIDAVYRLDLKNARGLRVKVTPLDKTFTIDQGQVNAIARYQAEFFKPGQTTPFETVNGSQDFSRTTAAPEHFDLGFNTAAKSPQAELEDVQRQMNDPKLTDTQRNALMMRMMTLQTQMLQGLNVNNPQATAAAEQKKNDDFGCDLITVYPGSAGAVQATIRCGKNFEGGDLVRMTGSMAIVK